VHDGRQSSTQEVTTLARIHKIIHCLETHLPTTFDTQQFVQEFVRIRLETSEASKGPICSHHVVVSHTGTARLVVLCFVCVCRLIFAFSNVLWLCIFQCRWQGAKKNINTCSHCRKASANSSSSSNIPVVGWATASLRYLMSKNLSMREVFIRLVSDDRTQGTIAFHHIVLDFLVLIQHVGLRPSCFAILWFFCFGCVCRLVLLFTVLI
jgi:hypothetical protein